MRLIIAGATGGVGKELVRQALHAGHEVTALARHPESLPAQVRGIELDFADVSPATVSSALAGAQAVLSALGPRSKAEAGIVTAATKSLLDGMKEGPARRLVVVSAQPVPTISTPARPNPLKSDPGDGFFTRAVLNPLVRKAFGATYRDLAEMEDLVQASELDWTIVRPPRLLNRELTGRYRTAFDRNLPGGRSVSRANVAHFMLAALNDPATIGQAVRIAD